MLNFLFPHFHLNNAFFVIRAKENMLYEVLDSREVDQFTGLFSDETIKLTMSHSPPRSIPILLDLLCMKTSAQIQFTVFSPITSRLRHSTVVKLYRERWQIELFFKWIKQHLHIKTFFENIRNAVFAQIWIPSVTVFYLSLLRNIIC